MYSVFRNLAIIILSAKFFGLVARKCKAPQVVGEILAGLIIGLCAESGADQRCHLHLCGDRRGHADVHHGPWHQSEGTDQAGPIATLVACVGVAVPLVGGTLLYSAFYGFSAVGSLSSIVPCSSARS